MPETPLTTYLRIQRATDRQLLDALRASATRVDAELRRLSGKTQIGDRMRAQQIRQSQVAINNEMARLWANVGDTVEAAKAKAAADGAETILRESKDVLRSVLSEADYDYMAQSARATASQGLEALERRVSGTSYVPLSESVYNNTALSQGKVDEIVNSALARGASAAELARDVRAFVDPNTPGGVRYAAMRLGRTEINNSFHASQIKQAQEEPWTLAVKWNLSGSHPVPDECNQYAENQHFSGGEAGHWKPEEVPGKPHPNCLCYTTPVPMSEDEFVDAFVKGDFDSYFEDELGLDAPEMVRMSPQKAVREYAWGQGDSGNLVYGELNAALRSGTPVTGAAADVQQGLDKMFNLIAPTTRASKVYRQLPGDDPELVQDLLRHAREQKPWTDKGFVSTTKNEDILPDFAGFEGGGVRLNIEIPKGSKVIHVDDYLEEMDYRQDEWLLPRDTKFNFSRPRPDGEGGWIIDAVIGDVPPKPVKTAVSSRSRIEQLENLIASETARAKKAGAGTFINRAAQQNITTARIELRKLRAKKK